MSASTAYSMRCERSAAEIPRANPMMAIAATPSAKPTSTPRERSLNPLNQDHPPDQEHAGVEHVGGGLEHSALA